jgi:hypothetical protein
MKMKWKSIVVLAMTFFFSDSTVHGSPFWGDIGGWGTVITFDEYILPQNEVVTDQYASLGVTFSANPLYKDPIINSGEWEYFYL